MFDLSYFGDSKWSNKYERNHKNDPITSPTKLEKINLSKGEPRTIEIINYLILGFPSKNYR